LLFAKDIQDNERRCVLLVPSWLQWPYAEREHRGAEKPPSAYLQQVRAGEEADVSAEELVLVASGQLVLPSKKLNERAF
jgi:hypothetical protein